MSLVDIYEHVIQAKDSLRWNLLTSVRDRKRLPIGRVRPALMLYVPPPLRFRIDADLGGNSRSYVLALEGLSIVAVLRELAWQLSVTLSQSFLDEAEYAGTLIGLLSPMASTSRLLPTDVDWHSHASLHLCTERRRFEHSEEREIVVLLEFHAHDLQSLRNEALRVPLHAHPKLIAAYEEEATIIRSLDGFTGESWVLLERLRAYMESGGLLARAQLFDCTVKRAQVVLHCLYSADPITRMRIDEIASWLIRLQGEEGERRDESSASLSSALSHIPRLH